MGITEIARLPTFSNLQLLYSHLNSNFSSTSSSKWTLTISSYRSLPFLTSTNTNTQNKGRILWTINDTSFPGITFVFIEDLSKPDRETYRKQIRNQESDKNIDQSNEDNQSLSSSIPNLSHPKFQSQILSNTFLPLLLKTNLPPPLGAPSSGTGEKLNQPINGPGAFVQRGVPVVIEGMEMFVGELDQRTDSISHNSGEGNGKEMKVRIGGISSGAGTGRNFGTVFELEYLPLKNLSNFSPFLPSLLYSLLPPTLLNPNLTNQQPRNPSSNASNANQNDPRNQNQNQNQTLQQPTPIILSSSVIQKETMAEALPSLFESLKSKDKEDQKGKEHQDQGEDQDQGWIGLEKGRRSCLLLLLMLKSEGILQ